MHCAGLVSTNLLNFIISINLINLVDEVEIPLITMQIDIIYNFSAM